MLYLRDLALLGYVTNRISMDRCKSKQILKESPVIRAFPTLDTQPRHHLMARRDMEDH